MSELATGAGILAALIGGILWLLGAARRQGRADASADRDAETLQRIEAGRKAGAAAAAGERTADQIVRGNDGRW